MEKVLYLDIWLVYVLRAIKGKGENFSNTAAQKCTLLALLRSLREDFPDAEILGHRDLPGVKKACPGFDVRTEYQGI